MNNINGDEVRLFDNQKKLTFPDCPESSLDGIGSDLLSDDFLKADNGISRSGGSGTFSDPLLIINNELSSERQITLDDVDLDLSSLSTLENNGMGSQPQESLGFNDFLSGSTFCLNGLEKLPEPEKQLSFESFGGIPTDQTLCKIQGKEFKIVPTYVDGKLSNTLHLEDHADKIFQEIASTSAGLSVTPTCPVTSSSEKVTATIEDFPSMSMVTGNTLTLNGQVQTTLPSCEIEPDISDLIKVKPREPKKIKKKPTKFTSVKKRKKKKLDRQNSAALEKSSTKQSTSDVLMIKTALTSLASTSDASQMKPNESLLKSGIPKFKVVQQTDTATGDTPLAVTVSKFSNGTLFLPSNEPSPGAPTVTATAITSQLQPLELIIPIDSIRDENSPKTLKSITDLKPGDLGNQGLSQMQKQQIAVILKQREALKRATGSSSNGPKRNENKIICKVFCPEDFFDAKQSNGSSKIEAAKEETTAKGVEDAKSHDGPPKPKKPKIPRPRQNHMNEEFEADIPLAPSVTRSGRTSRPPKKLVKRDVKQLTGKKEKEDEPKQPAITASVDADAPKSKPELLDGLPAKKKLSKRPSNLHTCPTCSKTYIEAKIFLKHLEAFPTHGGSDLKSKVIDETLNQLKSGVPPLLATAPVRPKKKCRCKCKNSVNCRARSFSFKQTVDTLSEKEFVKICGPRFVKATSVWDFLLLRVRAVYKYEDHVKGMLSELGKLWDSLKAVSAKILYPSDEPTETTVTLEDNTTCEVLGVSKGVYQTFPSGLETPTSVVNEYQGEPQLGGSQSTVPPPDTKEDISQSSLLSDIQSGMDTVDQLVNERLKTLAPSDDMLDPPSDDLMTSLLNSVNPNSLTDSMFNPLVSASNEDLLKALENLSNPIPPLDFTALTNDYPER